MKGAKRVFSALLAGAVCAGGLCAEEKVAIWKWGNVYDNRAIWGEPSNWDVGIVPGRYTSTDADGNIVTNGTKGWTVRFEGFEGANGNWLCAYNNFNIISVSNVVFSGNNTTTSLGQGKYQTIRFEPGGGVHVEESCKTMPKVDGVIGLADDRELNGTYRFRNDSLAGELHIVNGFAKFTKSDGRSDYPRIRFEGKGAVRLGGGFYQNSGFRVYVYMAMEEGGLLVVTNTVGNFNALCVSSGIVKQHVRIEPNSVLRIGAQPDQYQLDANSDLEISGEGTFGIDMTSGYLNIGSGATVEIKSAVAQLNTAESAAFNLKGGGTMRITGRNDIPQDLTLYDGTTFEASRIGMAGEAGEPGLGSAVRFYNGGILRYTGAGETTDRGLVLLSGQGNVVQAGTGPLAVSGDISASKSGTTLVLSNDTEFPLTLSGTVAAANSPAIRKTGSGEVVLSGSNLSSGGITAESGTLTVASATALPKLTVAGNVVLYIAEGVEATVDLTYSSGSLDVRAGNGAKFRASGMSGFAPDWLTVNGGKAKFVSDGSLVAMAGNDVEIAARGGVIPNAPDSVVGIVRDGDSGFVTLAAASTRVIALSQEASVDAVVRFGEGETLTVETVTVKTNAAPLVFGASAGTGALDAFGETLSFDAQDTNSLIVVRTGLAVDTAKTLCAIGAGKVLLPDDFQWSGNLQIDAGTVAYTNTTGAMPAAALSGSGTFEIAGDADKTLSGSNPGFTGKSVLCGGVNVVENPGFFGKSQSGDHIVTTTIQVKEGAELHVPSALGERNIVLGGSGTDGTGALKLTGSENMYSGTSGIELTSDTVVTGLVSLGSAYFGILRWSTYRATVDMNGHKLTKAGNGRFLLEGGDVVNPGEIEIIGPSGIWMQKDFDLGPEDSPPLVMSGNTTFASENIMPQRRPLVVDGGSLSFNCGQINRNRRDVDIWKGPVTLADPASGVGFILNGKNSSSRFSLEGEVAGPGRIGITYESLGILEILNPDNSGWTGALDINGSRGGSVYAAYPASIPPPNLVTCEFTRVIAPMPNWTRADILNYANNANLKGSGFISVDTTSVEDGSVFNLADSDVTGDDFAIAHDGGNSLALNIADGISKPIGLGSFNGTLKVSSPGTLRLSRLVASSDSTNGCGRIVLDGAKDVRLAGTYESARAGAAMHNYTKGDCGEIEIRNSLVRTDTEFSSSPRICVGQYGDGLLKIGEGAAVTARVDFAMGSGGTMGAVWQTGGEICDYYAGVSTRDIGTQGAVYHEVRGGKASYDSGARMAMGGTVILGIYGGLMYIGETVADYPCLGSGGGFHLYVKGGTFRSKGKDRTYLSRQSSNHKSSAFITVDGDDGCVDFCSQPLYMGGGKRSGEDGPVKAILNMNAGVLSAGAIGRYPSYVDETVQRAYVNFNGGTYRLQGDTSFGVSNGYPTVPSRITVFEGGATIDTAGRTGAYSSAPFRKPTGNSVVSVPVPSEIASRELIVPPYIEIFDFNGEGDGATAYAELDTSTRRVSGIIVTSPGWDYSAPKAVFKLGGTIVCTNDCAVAPAVGGGFTKTGEGTYLLAATNTYTGATVVKGGTLKIKFAEALPSNTVVSLQGGTLDLNGCTVPVAKIVGDGDSIVNGSVAMDGLEYDIADGECVTYGCPVAFASGAAVKLLNADSLDKDRRYVIAHFKGGVQNVPLAFEGLPDEIAVEWKLMLSAGYLKLYRPRGSVVVFR